MKNSIVFLLVALSFCVLVVGCGKIAEVGTVSETDQAAQSRHVYEQIREGFLIDADIEPFIGNDMPAVYQAEPKCISENEIEAFLEKNGDSIISSQEMETENYKIYRGTCKSGSTIFQKESINGHPYSVFQYRNEEKDMYYNDYHIYIGEDSFDPDSKFSVSQMFTEKKEFAFASSQEAEQDVRDALAALGFSDLILVRTLYADHETMEKAGEILSSDERFASLKDDKMANNGYPIKSDWSKDDDCYIFGFLLGIHGVPLSYRFEVYDTENYCGSQIVVNYTKDGIVSLSIDSPWFLKEVVDIPSEIVSAGTVLESAKERLGNIASGTDLVVEKVTLEYEYCQDESTWLLSPVWVVTVSKQMEYVDARKYEYLRFNAITGEEN